MVQTRSMATINQETGNPSNAMKRQVQTLVAAVERLTQRNEMRMAQAMQMMKEEMDMMMNIIRG